MNNDSNVVSFYGSRMNMDERWLAKLLDLKRDRTASLDEPPVLPDIPFVWQTFPALKPALQFLADIPPRPNGPLFRCFSVEHPSYGYQGARGFIVTTEEWLTRRYFSETEYPAGRRHLYEVILAELPCHLYFDLEFDVPCNPDLDPDLLMAAFYDALDFFFHLRFGLALPGAALNAHGVPSIRPFCVELCASHPAKFSKHVILKLPEYRWIDNRRCGQFVVDWIAHLRHARSLPAPPSPPHPHARSLPAPPSPPHPPGAGNAQRPLLPSAPLDPATLLFSRLLMVHKSDSPQQVACIDTSVYSKNRSFRLLSSSKLSKPAFPFAPSPANPAGPWFAPLPPPQQLLASLVSAPRGHPSKFLCCCAVALSPAHACQFAQLTTLRPSSFLSPSFLSPHSTSSSSSSSSSFSSFSLLTNADFQRDAPSLAALDAYVLRRFVERHGGPAMWVRGVDLAVQRPLPAPAFLLSYRTDGNNFCANIGRQHKSNKITLTVALSGRDALFWQACFDPDCRQKRFRSDPEPLPSEVSRPAYLALESYLFQLASDSLPDAYFLEAESIQSQPAPPPPQQSESDDLLPDALFLEAESIYLQSKQSE